MDSTHTVINLTTMGTSPNSAIAGIAGAVFSTVAVDPPGIPPFNTRLDWRNQGRHISLQTKAWWAEQDDDARTALDGLEPLAPTLRALSDWFPSGSRVWARGPTFEISILEHAFTSCGLEVPWSFWDIRDTRTLLDTHETLRGGLHRITTPTTHGDPIGTLINHVEDVARAWAALTRPAPGTEPRE